MEATNLHEFKTATKEEYTRIFLFAFHFLAALMNIFNWNANDIFFIFLTGASLSATTPAGRTALHVASAQGQSKIVDVLLESGMCS